MAIAQVFCTVADLLAAKDVAGGDEAVLMRAIRSASDYLVKEIGCFIPITETRKVDGNGKTSLVVPPFLALTSITHDGTALTSVDYFLRPIAREWPNGPYSWMEINPDSTILQVWKNEAQVLEMACRWGMYEETADTGTTLSASKQLVSDTTLTVLDGSKISPGMIVKIEDEQELVTGYGSPTAGVTTVSAAVALIDEEITLTDETKVNVGEMIRIDFEKMKILDINATTSKASVLRNYNETKKTTHDINTAVDVYRTFTVDRGVNGTTAAEHAASTAVSRYKVPEDLGFLTREIAVLMNKKEQSDFAGRTGDAALGTVFYNDAFPRDDLERIKKNYKIKGQ